MGTVVILKWAKTTESNCVATFVIGLHNRKVVDLGVGYKGRPYAGMRIGDYNRQLLSKLFRKKKY